MLGIECYLDFSELSSERHMSIEEEIAVTSDALLQSTRLQMSVRMRVYYGGGSGDSGCCGGSEPARKISDKDQSRD